MELQSFLLLEVVIAWMILSIVAGALGAHSKLGFWGVFVLALLLSPLVGLFFAFIPAKRQMVDLPSGNSR